MLACMRTGRERASTCWLVEVVVVEAAKVFTDYFWEKNKKKICPLFCH